MRACRQQSIDNTVKTLIGALSNLCVYKGTHRTQAEFFRALFGVCTVDEAWLRPVTRRGAAILGGRGVREHS